MIMMNFKYEKISMLLCIMKIRYSVLFGMIVCILSFKNAGVAGFAPFVLPQQYHHHQRQHQQRHQHYLLSHKSQNENHDDFLINHKNDKRRTFLTNIISGMSIMTTNPSFANALPLFGTNDSDRRQLELCIVSLLRLQYFAESVKQQLIDTMQDAEENKKTYLETRLGAKAVLTKKIGGGATSRVYTLATLQLRGCLDDLLYYAKKQGKNARKEAENYKDDIIDSLAAIVEFDGLESTQDPSPRSTLMLSQYSPAKAIFVKRMLSERLIPTIQSLIDLYGPTVRDVCKTYVKDTYPNEIPKKKEVVIPAQATSSTENANNASS